MINDNSILVATSNGNSFRSRPLVKDVAYIRGRPFWRDTKDNMRSTVPKIVGEDGSESVYEVESKQVERDARFAICNLKIRNLRNKIVPINCNLHFLENYLKRWEKYLQIK